MSDYVINKNQPRPVYNLIAVSVSISIFCLQFGIKLPRCIIIISIVYERCLVFLGGMVKQLKQVTMRDNSRLVVTGNYVHVSLALPFIGEMREYLHCSLFFIARSNYCRHMSVSFALLSLREISDFSSVCHICSGSLITLNMA